MCHIQQPWAESPLPPLTPLASLLAPPGKAEPGTVGQACSRCGLGGGLYPAEAGAQQAVLGACSASQHRARHRTPGAMGTPWPESSKDWALVMGIFKGLGRGRGCGSQAWAAKLGDKWGCGYRLVLFLWRFYYPLCAAGRRGRPWAGFLEEAALSWRRGRGTGRAWLGSDRR